MPQIYNVEVENLLKWLALTAVSLVLISITFVIIKLRRSYNRASGPHESKSQHTPRTAEEYNEWLQDNYKAPSARRAQDDLVLPLYFSYLKAQCAFFSVLCIMGLLLAFTRITEIRAKDQYFQIPAAVLVSIHALLCDGIEILFLHKGVGDGPLQRTYWLSAIWGCFNGLVVSMASSGILHPTHTRYSLWMPVMIRVFFIFVLNFCLWLRIASADVFLYLSRHCVCSSLPQFPLRRASSLRHLVLYNTILPGLAIILWLSECLVLHTSQYFQSLDFVLLITLFVYFVGYILVLVRALQRDSQMWRDFGVNVETQANPALQPLLSGVLVNLDFSRLHYGPVINSGTFATVFRGTYKSEKGYIIPVAIKAMRCFQLDEELIQDFCGETNALLHLEHRNVVMLFGVCVDPPRLAIVMELCQSGSLEDRIEAHVRRKSTFHLVSILRYAVQLAEAVAFMHEKGILHRDLKPANILFALKGGVLKLCDLGLASTRERLDGNKLFLGTPEYMAPELHALRNRRDPATVSLKSIIERAMIMAKDGSAPSTDQILTILSDHNIRSVEDLQTIEPDALEEACAAMETTDLIRKDIRAALMPYVADLDYGADAWAFGIILWQLCVSKRAPWIGMKEMAIKKAVLRGDRPEVPDSVEPVLRKLINRCLSYHRQSRPGFAEIQFTLHQLEIQITDESMSEVMESSWGQPLHTSLVEPFAREESALYVDPSRSASQESSVVNVRGSLQGEGRLFSTNTPGSDGSEAFVSSITPNKEVTSKGSPKGHSVRHDESTAAAMLRDSRSYYTQPFDDLQHPKTLMDAMRSILQRGNRKHRSSYRDRSQLINRPPGTINPGTPRRPSDPPRPPRTPKVSSKDMFPEVGNSKDPSSTSDLGHDKPSEKNSKYKYGSNDSRRNSCLSNQGVYNLLSVPSARYPLDSNTILKVQSAEAIGEYDDQPEESPPDSPIGTQKMFASKSAQHVSPFKMWPAGAVTVYT
eukprot:gb/GEZN01001230.1/.p1 GENE.gb/GEZN01001230.1/~~gb/GEZN01001230.1/.p1  ORF type:complete len:982 (+),score=96.45 gb/GEZN01001230.1/:129-3074(+)